MRDLREALALKDYEFNAEGIELNRRYTSGAVIPDPDAAPEEFIDQELYAQSSSRPGAKLPHAWLVGDDGKRLSTLDVVGKGRLTLVTGLSGAVWRDAADALDLPALRSVVIGEPGAADLYFEWHDVRDAPEGTAFLVRPTASSPGVTSTSRLMSPTPAIASAPRCSRSSIWTTSRRRLTTNSRRSTDDRAAPVHQRLVRLAQTEFSQGFIDAGGYRTRYLRAGDPTKPKLVLLHGITGHAEAYVRNLRSHGEHFDVWAIDLIGHGYSAKPEHPLEIPDYLDHVNKFLDAIGAESAYFSGESLGGWVIARLAAQQPERVERFALNTPGGTRADPKVMERLYTLSMEAARDPSWERVKARLEWLMADPSMVTDDLIRTRQAIFQQPTG